MSTACPHCGGSAPIGYEVPGVYDGALFWLCQRPGCVKAYHRWPEGHYLRDRAQSYIDARNIERAS